MYRQGLRAESLGCSFSLICCHCACSEDSIESAALDRAHGKVVPTDAPLAPVELPSPCNALSVKS